MNPCKINTNYKKNNRIIYGHERRYPFQTARSMSTRGVSDPMIALQSPRRAKRTFLRRIPLFFHSALKSASMTKTNDISRNSRRTTTSVGVLFSLCARKSISLSKRATTRKRGLRMRDHMPISLRSHRRPSLSGIPPVGERVLPKEDDKVAGRVAVCSSSSRRSVSAARCAWTLSTACSSAGREGGRWEIVPPP